MITHRNRICKGFHLIKFCTLVRWILNFTHSLPAKEETISYFLSPMSPISDLSLSWSKQSFTQYICCTYQVQFLTFSQPYLTCLSAKVNNLLLSISVAHIRLLVPFINEHTNFSFLRVANEQLAKAGKCLNRRQLLCNSIQSKPMHAVSLGSYKSKSTVQQQRGSSISDCKNQEQSKCKGLIPSARCGSHAWWQRGILSLLPEAPRQKKIHDMAAKSSHIFYVLDFCCHCHHCRTSYGFTPLNKNSVIQQISFPATCLGSDEQFGELCYSDLQVKDAKQTKNQPNKQNKIKKAIEITYFVDNY